MDFAAVDLIRVWCCHRICVQIETLEALCDHCRRPPQHHSDLVPRVLAHRLDARLRKRHLIEDTYSAINAFRLMTDTAETFRLFERALWAVLRASWVPLHKFAWKNALLRGAIGISAGDRDAVWMSGAAALLPLGEAHRLLTGVCRGWRRGALRELARCPHLGYSRWRFWNAARSAAMPFMFGNERWRSTPERPPLQQPATELRALLADLPPVRGLPAGLVGRGGDTRKRKRSPPEPDRIMTWGEVIGVMETRNSK